MDKIKGWPRNRRQFIQLSLFAAALAVSSSCNQKETANLSASNKANSGKGNILVIGAGIAGLAAARELQNNGFKVTIIEGRDRIGGRIYTDRSLGYAIDLGAAWIHGIQNNPIGKLAKDSNIKILRTNYDNSELYGINGRPVNENQLSQAESLSEEIIEQAKALGERLDKDISVAEAVKRVIKKQQLTAAQQKLVQWQLNSNIVVETGTDMSDLSIQQFDEDEAFAGDDFLFPNGYDQISQILAKDIDIKLQQNVQEINYTGSGVTVKTNAGSFSADAVVITLPLGVLKADKVKFSPALPSEKTTAIQRLAMGVLNKVILKFPQPFWETEYDMIGLMSAVEKDFSEFVNLYKYNSAPVLVGLTGGSFARSLESLSETEIAQQVMKLLRRTYGNNIPNPEKVLRTQWSQDRFSFGAYSYVPVGGSMEDRDALAKPVNKRLFFAGEATSRDYPATVHGAFLSGLREAKKIKAQF